MRRNLLAVITSASILLLATSGPASAQGFLASLTDSVFGFFQNGNGVYPATPPRAKEDPTVYRFDFWETLKDAGYELKEFKTGVGIIPDIGGEFDLARELSDADRAYLERKILIDEVKRRGFKAAIQREIIRSLLAASDLQELRITKLEITLLPLPAASFVTEPKELPMSEEHDAIFRAVQGHSETQRRIGRSPVRPAGKTNGTPAPTID
jgi:hypothetical protein